MIGMYFCKECGKMLELEKETNRGKCSCGFATNLPEMHFSKTKEKDEIGSGILKEDLSSNGFPHTCKKCGYGECDVVDLGPPVSDESSVYLYRCKKCKFVERQAD